MPSWRLHCPCFSACMISAGMEACRVRADIFSQPYKPIWLVLHPSLPPLLRSHADPHPTCHQGVIKAALFLLRLVVLLLSLPTQIPQVLCMLRFFGHVLVLSISDMGTRGVRVCLLCRCWAEETWRRRHVMRS